jgi:predicted TIM-barrel fold metal-dependent hydrolase
LIVDGHTHIIPNLGNPSIVDIKFDWSDLEQWLSSEPGSKCVIMPTITQFCNSVALNDDFFERLKKFPKKNQVFAFLWVHPNQVIEDHFKNFAFSGFKFHPSISQTTVTENEEMLNLCAKYKKPILVHCGRGEKSRIDYVLGVNEHYPDLKFICAHMGGLAIDLIIRAYEKISQLKYLDNIYLDTSGCFHPELIEKAVQLLGNEKVIFATDRPFHSYKMSLYVVNCCNFDKEIRRKILSENILNILHTDLK